MCDCKSETENTFLEVSSPCPGVTMTSSLPCRETHAENRPSAAGVHVPGLHVAEDESDRRSSQVRQNDKRTLPLAKTHSEMHTDSQKYVSQL